jgi:hypothetical protein
MLALHCARRVPGPLLRSACAQIRVLSRAYSATLWLPGHGCDLHRWSCHAFVCVLELSSRRPRSLLLARRERKCIHNQNQLLRGEHGPLHDCHAQPRGCVIWVRTGATCASRPRAARTPGTTAPPTEQPACRKHQQRDARDRPGAVRAGRRQGRTARGMPAGSAVCFVRKLCANVNVVVSFCPLTRRQPVLLLVLCDQPDGAATKR